jgi:signal transduction histidine kinase
MTLRLVALMSVVLLLSLAAFGLLVNHYQDEVMAEVARTASAAGRAALGSLEFGPHVQAVGGNSFTAGSEVFVFSAPFDAADDTAALETLTGEADVAKNMRHVRRVIERYTESDGEHDQHVIAVSYHEGGVEELSVTGEAIDCEIVPQDDTGRCVTAGGSDGGKIVGEFIFRLDEIHAEPDPTEGLVLKIPRKAPDAMREKVIDRVQLDAMPARVQAGAVPGWVEEIRLPLPVEDYKDLFDSLRKRSLFLFFGVFLVGTALSAGLATRFTRPIRKLDSGIRRLTDGDLDARVEVRGKGEVARVSRAFNEMTRRLRENRDRARELVRKEKLSALGRLAAGVAHDVRNPLHSIGLTLQHLHDTGRPEEAGRANEFDRSLEIIRGEIRRLDRLVGSFLTFAGNEHRERRMVDLEELVRETANLVRKEAEWRNIEIALEVDSPVSEVSADPESIRSAILNLVLNSFEAMPRGGKLAIRLESLEEELVLEVSDSGEGIPPADQERVFDFGHTTREGGNGLGLATVHHCIVAEHGGRVALDSRPGEGTRVRLTLPLRRKEES